MCEISYATGRQIGVLVDRKGNITHVVVGDATRIVLPDLSYFRYHPGRLKGVRCIHTHFGLRGIDDEDITDLLMLRLDAMVVVTVLEDGYPGEVQMAYILPPNPSERKFEIVSWGHPSKVNIDFRGFISELEEEIERTVNYGFDTGGYSERAILISVLKPQDWPYAEYYISELLRLCESSGILVLDKVIQKVTKYNPEFLIGKGKLQDIVIRALYLGATMLVFNEELTPTQMENIAKITDLKVIDRTQLILDIFARRAISMEGKLQVELAQLKYTYPRIIGRGAAMSRLAGGIGGRGPGETKLEMDRRNIKRRISFLEDRLNELRKRRSEMRKKRKKMGLPVISLVGYTNAGKTSLLNALTGSDGYVADKFFATLDPLARSINIDGIGKCIITDTVGLIRRMPEDIKVAFRATLEELYEADVIVHVIDVSSPFMEEEIEVVEGVLAEMGVHFKPVIRVYNKMDLLPEDIIGHLESNGYLLISAKNKVGLEKLIDKIREILTLSVGIPS